jgi:hypothetical protein
MMQSMDSSLMDLFTQDLKEESILFSIISDKNFRIILIAILSFRVIDGARKYKSV